MSLQTAATAPTPQPARRPFTARRHLQPLQRGAHRQLPVIFRSGIRHPVPARKFSHVRLILFPVGGQADIRFDFHASSISTSSFNTTRLTPDGFAPYLAAAPVAAHPRKAHSRISSTFRFIRISPAARPSFKNALRPLRRRLNPLFVVTARQIQGAVWPRAVASLTPPIDSSIGLPTICANRESVLQFSEPMFVPPSR